MSWQHFSEVRSLIQSSWPDRWQRVAVLMVGHGGDEDPAARAYVVSAIERLPMHERPCRIVVSDGGGGSIAKLKSAEGAVVPGADVTGRVKRFNQYVTGPLFGGHFTDFSGPTPIKRPFLEARAQGIAALIASARDADDWGNDPRRRETVLDELHRASKDRLKDLAAWNDDNKALYDAHGHARLFVRLMENVDHDIHNGPNVSWEDARHERLAFCRIVNLFGMLKIPTGIAHLSACGISKETGCVEYAWKEDDKRTVGLLFNEGQFLRQLHAYAKPHEQGYPMPSAEVGGPTTWIKVQGEST